VFGYNHVSDFMAIGLERSRVSRTMLSALFHHFIPASLNGGQTAFRTLAGIDRELEHCQSPDSTVSILERSKADLYARLCERSTPLVAQALTVKILNLFLARHHLRTRSASVLSRPFGLVIDPSNMCQLACPGCVHSTRNEALKVFDWPAGTLSEARLSALLKLYGPYAIGAYFCNYGEPLLNLQTPKLIRLAKTYLMGTALSTSLSVRRFDADAYVESGLDFMVMSIDGATQRVYERFRRQGDLELVFSNIRKLVDAKRRLRKRTPVLSWNFLAFEHNVHEISLATRMAWKLGVNQFRIVNPFDVRWDDPEIRAAPVKGSVRRLHSLSIASQADNWNPFPESVDGGAIARAFDEPWSKHVATDSPPSSGHTCHWLYKNIVMDATGRIMPCCGGPRPDTNLVFDTFDGNGSDVFNSERYRQARAWFSGSATAAGAAVSDDAPHCTQCEWDQTTVNIGSEEIRRYFRAADAAFFDRRSLRLLSDW
jgi:MoaA/NifB/PqqE/SkfB family radical SAM enzyme